MLSKNVSGITLSPVSMFILSVKANCVGLGRDGVFGAVGKVRGEVACQ